MKLYEAEVQRSELNGQVQDLRKDLKNQNADISMQIASKLETLMVEMIGDASDTFHGFEQLCTSKKESKDTLNESKASIEKNLAKIFKVIGKERSFELIQEELWTRRRNREQFDQSVDGSNGGSDSGEEEMLVIHPSESITGLIHGFSKAKMVKKEKPPIVVVIAEEVVLVKQVQKTGEGLREK